MFFRQLLEIFASFGTKNGCFPWFPVKKASKMGMF